MAATSTGLRGSVDKTHLAAVEHARDQLSLRPPPPVEGLVAGLQAHSVLVRSYTLPVMSMSTPLGGRNLQARKTER